ncbi:MAG: hypothetical protein ACP5LA_07325, partial [Thermoplasmata archaeon]
VKDSHAQMKMLFWVRGYSATNKKQANSSPFKEQIGNAIKVGIHVKACSISLKNEDPTKYDIFMDLEPVLGEIKTNLKIDEGHSVITT